MKLILVICGLVIGAPLQGQVTLKRVTSWYPGIRGPLPVEVRLFTSHPLESPLDSNTVAMVVSEAMMANALAPDFVVRTRPSAELDGVHLLLEVDVFGADQMRFESTLKDGTTLIPGCRQESKGSLRTDKTWAALQLTHRVNRAIECVVRSAKWVSDTGTNPQVQERVEKSGPIKVSSEPAALAAFLPLLPATTKGGECMPPANLRGSPSFTAQFPTRTQPEMMATIFLDSVGRVSRYSEMRGVPKPSSLQQLDSAMHNMSRVMITVNYAKDEFVAINAPARSDPSGIRSSLDALKDLAAFSDLPTTIELVRKICHVPNR